MQYPQYNGKHSNNPHNKEFVEWYELLSSELLDYEIAEKMGIPSASFSKIKLGYWYAKPTYIQSIRNVVDKMTNNQHNLKLVKDSKKSLTVSKVNNKPSINSKKLILNIPSNFTGVIELNVKG